MTMGLDQLLKNIVPAPALAVAGITLDSRQVVPGGAFIALSGLTSHGLCFADEALRRGASCILFESPVPPDVLVPESAIEVPALRSYLGLIAERFYGAPTQTMRVVGVTGTNGKTSTVQMLAQALTLDGEVAGSIGTLGVGLYGALKEGERTTPDVLAVHASMAEMRAQGATHVAMEVSSHALDQGRVDGVHFDVAIFTNLTRDHLDYHGDMASYGQAKSRLFAWEGLRAAVINCDDEFGAQLACNLSASVTQLRVSSQGNVIADLRAENIQLSSAGVSFELHYREQREVVESTLLGRFNVDNQLAVAGVLLSLQWPLEKVALTLSQLNPVAGRMGRLGGDGVLPLVVVDYAHTPDALEQTLRSLRAHTQGRLFCVFGCGGERDSGKRPQMAAIAEKEADVVIVTDDNPRREDGDAIVADIVKGFKRLDVITIERDRAAAIAYAVSQAGGGDTVLIAGKGHEPYQEIFGVKHPFDDREIAQKALEASR